MSSVNLQPLETEEFAALIAEEDAEFRLRLTGNMDMRAVPSLESYLAQVHEEARRLQAPVVVVDFTGLEFMNSSCFRTLVSWLDWIKKLDVKDQYRLRLVADPKHHWQQPSLKALACFATELVDIEDTTS